MDYNFISGNVSTYIGIFLVILENRCIGRYSVSNFF